MLEILRAEADGHGVKLSAIAREAFDLYIARVVQNRCPRCNAVNSRGADWCGSCTAPLSPEAEASRIAEIESRDKQTAENLQQIEEVLTQTLRTQDRIIAELQGALNTSQSFDKMYAKCEACRRCPDRPATARPLPGPDQATIIPESEQT